MTDYKYVFGSLRDEQIIAEIPLYGVYMDLEMNRGGRFDGVFQLDQTGIPNDVLISASIPGKCWVCCERNGKPIWIGYIWSRTYQSQAKSMQIYAESFEQYPTHQLIRSDINTSSEQLVLFRNLWSGMQAVAGRNMNIQIPSGSLPTIATKAIEYLATDYKYYSEIMSELADSTNGFDWTIDVLRQGAYYVKTLRFGYPTSGATDPNLITFDYPGTVLNYYATETMGEAGTHGFVLGQGEGDEMPVGTFTHGTMVNQGWPRWDVVLPRKDLTSNFAVGWAADIEGPLRKPPRLVIKPSMKADKIPEFGSFALGDACTLAIKDSRFPLGFKFNTRITKWALSPQQQETSDEFFLIFQGDEDNSV